MYIREILASPEYMEYARIRDEVKKNPDLKRQLDEFRARNFEIQRNKDTALGTLERFEREYQEFMEIPLVSEFLDAELAFCRMMQRNNNVIMNAIQFE